MTPLVSLENITKNFGTKNPVLQGVNLTVNEGEFISLLGASGCGKSTILRLLAGLEDPTSGSINWHNKKPETAFVFQESTLMPWANVLENVYLPLKLRKVPKHIASAKIEAALAKVGLSHKTAALPNELSGGMKMRASIARALVSEPKLLLMDEPFAALDEITRQALNDDLITLWQNTGCTIIFVTHSVNEAAYLSERIAILAGSPAHIASQEKNISPYPRAKDHRTSLSYMQLCQQTSQALHSAL